MLTDANGLKYSSLSMGKDINIMNKNNDLHLLPTVDVSQNIRHGCQIQH